MQYNFILIKNTKIYSAFLGNPILMVHEVTTYSTNDLTRLVIKKVVNIDHLLCIISYC